MGERMSRQAHKADFLSRHGYGDWQIKQIAGDASFRTYDRISNNGHTHILMDAPPPQEDVRPFMAMTRHLTGLGYSAPRLLGHDIDHGFLLLEDLGDDRYSGLIANTPALEVPLYETAIDLLIDLQEKPVPQSLTIEGAQQHTLAPYDQSVLAREVSLLTDWYMPAIGLDAPDNHAALQAAFKPLFDQVATPTTLVLRDYHSDNLMWLPDRSGHSRVGLLDYQDALIGHPAYDLMSLLEDARRDVSPELEVAMINRYLAKKTHLNRQDFLSHYHILAAGRNAKIIGIFTRLYVRDNKPAYLDLIPRVWGLLERNLAHPALKGAKATIDQLIPPDRRTIPQRKNG